MYACMYVCMSVYIKTVEYILLCVSMLQSQMHVSAASSEGWTSSSTDALQANGGGGLGREPLTTEG